MLLPEVCKLEIGCPYACFDQCCYLLCTTVWFVTIKIFKKKMLLLEYRLSIDIQLTVI